MISIHMFDTHCHLNFSAFKKKLSEVVEGAHAAGVTHIVIPGTDITSSQKAVEIAGAYEDMYAAVGIHPHHVYELLSVEDTTRMQQELATIETLLAHEKVVAVGEVGIDRFVYKQTKYPFYEITEKFVQLQRLLLAKQMGMAVKFKKSLIIHNREAKADLIEVLESNWDPQLAGRAVLHCCEPDADLFAEAKKRGFFLGVDGDITYSQQKQQFLKEYVGAEQFLKMYVLETDAPFLLPEPLRAQKKYPNKPENIPLIARFLAELMHIPPDEIVKRTTENAKQLFGITR